ncbi:hypothetical protein ACWPKO_27005 (plasmid) [Coraliomargarita sp. W4R53]
MSMALGLSVALRAQLTAIAAAVMVVLAVVGFALGSVMYDWAAPFPADIRTLLLHGARSPLVIGVTVLVATASLTRIISARPRAKTDQLASSGPRLTTACPGGGTQSWAGDLYR